MIRILTLALFAFTAIACSKEKSMLVHKRDRSFYAGMINPASDFAQAQHKLASLRLLQTSEDYPIRLALFDNGRFYYQVDKLGNGDGNWHFQEGALVLNAPRMLFDVEFWVSAAAATGSDVLVRFVDRHGMNTNGITLRDPAQMKSPPALREFKASDKDI